MRPTPSTETPSADELLQRLYSIDLEQFNIKELTEELKGTQAWIFAMVMPLAAILLVTFTLIGTFLTNHLIVSFVLSALLLFVIGKILGQYEQQFYIAARQEVINRIKDTEGEFGILPHFKDFLPSKYRHLWQSLNKNNYQYVDQYIAAVYLLQQKLEPDKFTQIWHLKYPVTNLPTEGNEANLS